ncbi:MAG: hypothetical protein KGJ84_01030 [Elusimicrobia bacterium]|nr:hypothetical protein [Elusimicrobiota bacterium]
MLANERKGQTSAGLARILGLSEMRIRKGLEALRRCGVRADALAIQGYSPHLREAMRGVNAYAVFEKTERSGLFLVESKIYKLFDF